ncbi:MAG: GGDEF domain-containing protein [Methyloligellaceae bacterium]
MDEHSQHKTALSLAKRTLDYIARYGTPPTPRVYELFYTVCTGLNPDLNNALAAIIAETRNITSDDADKLYSDFLSSEQSAKMMRTIGSQMNSQMSYLLSLLGSATVNANHYQTSLETAEQTLSSGPEPHTADALVQSLLQGTKTMAQTNAEITANLETTRAQVTQLEDCLKVAREETARDPVTGLVNRRQFDLLLDEAILKAAESDRPTSLLIADIDHFKTFNDTHGHIAGDSALRYVASCIKANAKSQDTAARIGGEEFAIIMPNTSIEHAVGVAERIRHLIYSRTLVKKVTKEEMGRISVSVGVTQLLEGDTADSFLDRADMCMYNAKKAGRNQVMDVPEPSPAADSAA